MKIKIGTRGSKLALAQTNYVVDRLKAAYPENEYDRALLVPTYNNGNPYEVPGDLTWTQTNRRLTITETDPQTHVAQIIAISKGSENIHTKVDHYPTSFDNSVYEYDSSKRRFFTMVNYL